MRKIKTSTEQIKIILSDHNEHILDIICQILIDSKNTRVVAQTICAQKIVDLAKKFTPDLVILAINMPGGIAGYRHKIFKKCNYSAHRCKSTLRPAFKQG
jgi:DNA-binding NarL/FixJ family response regulator